MDAIDTIEGRTPPESPGRMVFVNYLLLPDDEVEFAEFLATRLAVEPVGALALPGRDLPRRGSSEPTEFIYWASGIGPLRRLGDASPPIDAKDAVMRRLNEEAHPDDWQHLVDPASSPLIRLHRCNWNLNGCLNPGLLLAMGIPLKDQPRQLLNMYRAAERWLQASGERLNPFDHCSQPAQPQPRNMSRLWVWARPSALEWVRAGGEIWPWNA